MKKNTDNLTLDYLNEEYKRVDTEILEYTKRQINYMYFSIVLIGGSFSYIIENEKLSAYLKYYPFFLFLLFGLFALDLYRIQIFHAYRTYMATKINTILKSPVISTPLLTKKIILHPLNNIFYSFYTILWIIALFVLFYKSHDGKIFCSFLSVFQFIIILFLTLFFLWASYTDYAHRLVLKTIDPKDESLKKRKKKAQTDTPHTEQ